MPENAIEVRSLGKRYSLRQQGPAYDTLRDTIAGAFRRRPATPDAASFWALRDVSFDVAQGEAVAIIGRNGAGKSTLLKLLSRITEPTEGTARVRGRVGALLEVGTGFHPELSGRENIYLNGAILGMRRSEIDKNFRSIVEFAEIERFLDLPVKRYSSGMYLRLAFAVAAHLEPDVLVVDEVLAVGDLEFQKKCLGRMESIGAHGRTVLFVSHNMPAVARLCSRAVLLEQGVVKMVGGVKEVIEAYTKGVVAQGAARQYDAGARPGDAVVELVGVRVVGEDGKPCPIVDVRQPIDIAIDYTVKQAPSSFRVGVALQTQGADAFTSVEPAERTFARVGDHTSVVRIPAHLLTEGEYLVTVVLQSSRGVKQRHVLARDAVAFQTFDAMQGDSARGDYAEALSGLVRPRLSWSARDAR